MASGTFSTSCDPLCSSAKQKWLPQYQPPAPQPFHSSSSVFSAARTRKSLAVLLCQLLPAAHCSCLLPLSWESKANSYQFTIHLWTFCNLEFLLRGSTYLSRSRLIYTPRPPTSPKERPCQPAISTNNTLPSSRLAFMFSNSSSFYTFRTNHPLSPA